MPVLPDYMPATDEATPDRPFRMVTAPSRHFLNTCFTETPTSRQREGRPNVLLHPADAARVWHRRWRPRAARQYARRGCAACTSVRRAAAGCRGGGKRVAERRVRRRHRHQRADQRRPGTTDGWRGVPRYRGVAASRGRGNAAGSGVTIPLSLRASSAGTARFGCMVGVGVDVALFEPGLDRRTMLKNPDVVQITPRWDRLEWHEAQSGCSRQQPLLLWRYDARCNRRLGDRMKRRDVLAMLGCAMVALRVPTAVGAPAARIGFISGGDEGSARDFVAALRAGLAAEGYREPDTLSLDRRYADFALERIPPFVAELERQGVALIVTHAAATPIVVKGERRVPVVYEFSADPVATGIARDLAHPLLNATGITLMKSGTQRKEARTPARNIGRHPPRRCHRQSAPCRRRERAGRSGGQGRAARHSPRFFPHAEPRRTRQRARYHRD